MQPAKKKLQGMTLIEIVLSIAIYGMIAMLLTEVMCLINATIKSTQQLNTRLSYEAKYADNLLTNADDGTPFKTLEENVSITRNGVTENTSLPSVRVSIVYDGITLDRSTNVGYTESGVRTADNTAAAAFLRAAEYETDYNGTINGVNYHPNTNYKFMTFNKVGVGAAAKPEGSFILNVNITDSDASSITKLVVEAADGVLASGGTSQTILAADFPASGPIQIALTNNAPPTGSFGTTFQTVTITVYKNVIAPTSGKNLGERNVSTATAEVYTAVQVGSESPFENYYTNCSVTYTGGSGGADAWTFPTSS